MLAKLSVLQDIYNQYRCTSGSPLTCEQSSSIDRADSQGSDCPICKFPGLLAPDVKINGIRGSYQIEAFIGGRGMGRLYKGIRLIDSQPVTIKEYLLPPLYFNQVEVKTRLDTFKELVTPQLIHATGQDFRVLTADEAIADLVERRCFFITASAFSALTLEDYLHNQGAMNEAIIWDFLNQVLQSLIFLHSQTVRFASGRLQSGITHGNLSLSSILIWEKGPNFLYYLADLAVWEQIFVPEDQSALNLLSFSEAIAEDLSALGHVAFYMSIGRKFAQNGFTLDPKQEKNWTGINPDLKDYILSLMGFGSRNFDSAKTARDFLLKLKPVTTFFQAPSPPLIDTSEPSFKSRRWWWLGGGLLIILLLIFLWIWLLHKIRASQADSRQFSGCCLEQVDIPKGDYRYAALQDSAWDYVYTQQHLLGFNEVLRKTIAAKQPNLKHWCYSTKSINKLDSALIKEVLKKEDLSQTIAIKQPNLKNWCYDSKSTTQSKTAFLKEENKEEDFLIINPLNNLGAQYEILPFAYENLGVFVAFNYIRRQDGLPYLLNGKITIEQLRKLYTGKIKSWNKLDPRLPEKDVYLYIPADRQGEAVFKEKVLQDPESIRQYEELIGGKIITPLRTFDMLRAIIADFEDKGQISIGFDSMSKIIGQCSVYPLAIASQDKAAVSPLMLKDGQPIAPATDLCEQKGSYQINHTATRNQDYPLTYPLAVVFFRDNRRQAIGRNFAELLTTKEGQCLIKQVQLTPIYLINCPQPQEEK